MLTREQLDQLRRDIVFETTLRGRRGLWMIDGRLVRDEIREETRESER